MIQLHQGDCLEVLGSMPSDGLDALVTDPPAGISFMGKSWDTGKNFIGIMTEIYEECLRVLKPGAHGLVWALPRTSHWTATALEQAGFEIRDVVTHVFGSGFPKSLDVSKAIDKLAGAERDIVGSRRADDIRGGNYKKEDAKSITINITYPTTPEAKQWSGWGTALKPASEHWILVRRPLSEPAVAKNVLRWGTGGINVDASRIGLNSGEVTHGSGRSQSNNPATSFGDMGEKRTGVPHLKTTQGRFPANFVLSHTEDCEDACSPGCAVAELDAGGASRFFYCAKASKRDRNAGLEGMPEKWVPTQSGGVDHAEGRTAIRQGSFKQNTHPTVKATKLMEYLIRLITPPAGTVLDPFMGSGSTGVAAKRLGFGFVGIEREAEYFEIAKKRIS